MSDVPLFSPHSTPYSSDSPTLHPTRHPMRKVLSRKDVGRALGSVEDSAVLQVVGGGGEQLARPSLLARVSAPVQRAAVFAP